MLAKNNYTNKNVYEEDKQKEQVQYKPKQDPFFSREE